MQTLTTNNIENLVYLLQNKDETGLRILYRNYKDALYGVILNIVRSEPHAEEVLNDVFLKAYKNIHLYDAGKSKLFTWMTRIARNAALDKIRTADFRWSANTYDISNPIVEKFSITHEPNKMYDTAGLLQSLSGKQKRMIEMVYLLGYTQKECSDTLSIPLGTVKTNIRRALIKLRTARTTKQLL